MNKKAIDVLPIEQIVSILSYITMGIIGLIWLIIANYLKKRPRRFIMYNIVQSMVISIFLFIFNIIFKILDIIPGLNILFAKIYYYLTVKIIMFPSIGLNFSLIQIFISMLIVYISVGIILKRIFVIPYLSDFIQKIMKSYN